MNFFLPRAIAAAAVRIDTTEIDAYPPIPVSAFLLESPFLGADDVDAPPLPPLTVV